MKPLDLFLTIVILIIWYLFIWILIASIKYNISISLSSVVLLVLGFLGIVLCPWFRKTKEYKEIIK